MLDPWSVIWYMVSFAGLVSFFMVVSCFDCCCTKRAPITPPNSLPSSLVASASDVSGSVEDMTPPSYDHFAPPSYDALGYGIAQGCKKKCDVFVLPIHGHVMTMDSMTTGTPAEPR